MEEFEEKVTACHNKGADDAAGFERVAKASEKAAMRKSKQKTNAGIIVFGCDCIDVKKGIIFSKDRLF